MATTNDLDLVTTTEELLQLVGHEFGANELLPALAPDDGHANGRGHRLDAGHAGDFQPDGHRAAGFDGFHVASGIAQVAPQDDNRVTDAQVLGRDLDGVRAGVAGGGTQRGELLRGDCVVWHGQGEGRREG